MKLALVLVEVLARPLLFLPPLILLPQKASLVTHDLANIPPLELQFPCIIIETPCILDFFILPFIQPFGLHPPSSLPHTQPSADLGVASVESGVRTPNPMGERAVNQ
eukprot:GHVT01013024.1.p1 GENE.GHVT01013024.1~~GHVT01013024.1.p1  ORF type:complete len:107 (+),score=13.52 GHVT01013024.1:859-1179(+)